MCLAIFWDWCLKGKKFLNTEQNSKTIKGAKTKGKKKGFATSKMIYQGLSANFTPNIEQIQMN